MPRRERDREITRRRKRKKERRRLRAKGLLEHPISVEVIKETGKKKPKKIVIKEVPKEEAPKEEASKKVEEPLPPES